MFSNWNARRILGWIATIGVALVAGWSFGTGGGGGPTAFDTLRPVANGTYLEWGELFGSGTTHWDRVAEEEPDDLGSYIMDNTWNGTERDTFQLADTTLDTVDYVDVFARAARLGDPSYDNNVRLFIRSGTTDSESTIMSLPSDGSWVYVSQRWTTDPATGAAWTPAAVNALEAGVRNAMGPSGGAAVGVTQVYVVAAGHRYADLNVTYIERTPRQSRNCVSYPSFTGALGETIQQPVLVACDSQYSSNPEEEPHWPEMDSQVTFTGHIKNNGSGSSSSGTYQWFIDEGPGPATDQVLRPVANGTYLEWGELFGSGTTHWDRVAEEIADDYGSYIMDNTWNGTERDTFQLSDTTLTNIQYIEVFARAARITDPSYDNNVRLFVRSGTTDAESAVKTLPSDGSWLNVSQQWASDPATGSAWTTSAVNALEAGVRNAMGPTGGGGVVVTQVYVVVVGEGSGGGEVPIGEPQSIPAAALEPGGEATVTYTTTWKWDPAGPQVPGRPAGTTTHEYPKLRLAITANNDQYSVNNERTYYVLGKGMIFFIQEDWYEKFNTTQNGAYGTYSYEDWVQAQIEKMNEIMAESTYPDAPDGAYERVNLEKVRVVPAGLSQGQHLADWEQETGDSRWHIDGHWFQIGASASDPGFLNWFNSVIGGYDIPLVHELAHQIGIIDTYNIPYGGLSPYCLFGIMGGNQTPGCADKFELVHVLYLNQTLEYRSGYFGDFLYQKPETNTLQLKQANGTPLANAEVTIFQQRFNGQTAYPVGYGRTDANGNFVLPNQPSTPITTFSGFTQGSSNPFAEIHVVGINGWLWLSVTTEDGTKNRPIIFELTWASSEAMAGRNHATYAMATGLTPLAKGSGAPTFSSLNVQEGSQSYLRRVTASVSSDTQRVDFYVDGQLRHQDSTAPYEFDWDMRFERPGKHWISARAVKLSGETITTYTLSPAITGSLVQSDGSLIASETINPATVWGANVALNKPVTSSGVSTTNLHRLTDGVFGQDPYPDWNSSGVEEGDYIEIDLQEVKTISGLRIHNWPPNLGDQCLGFDVYATVNPVSSTDQPVVVRRFFERVATSDFAFAPRDARYIRWVCRGSPRWVHMQEIEVFEALP